MNLYLACALTMLIETAYWYLAGFRDRYFVIVCLAVNVATNLTMNMVLYAVGINRINVAVAEILVVIAEYAVYSLISDVSRKKLLAHTVAANALSFSIGLVLTSLYFSRVS